MLTEKQEKINKENSGGEKGIFRIIRYGTMSDDMVNPLCAYRKTGKNLAERRGFEPALYAQSFIVTYIVTYF